MTSQDLCKRAVAKWQGHHYEKGSQIWLSKLEDVDMAYESRPKVKWVSEWVFGCKNVNWKQNLADKLNYVYKVDKVCYFTAFAKIKFRKMCFMKMTKLVILNNL